jgi:hypothetical protein
MNNLTSEVIRQRLVQNFKARLIDGSLLIVLAAVLVVIASSTGGF